MNPAEKHYLDKFRAGLRGIPEPDRGDIVREIENHIAEAVDGGQSLADVLERLGPADRLARAYTADAILSGAGRPWRKWVKAAVVLAASSLASLFLIPFFGLVGAVCSLAGAAAVTMNLLFILVGPRKGPLPFETTFFTPLPPIVGYPLTILTDVLILLIGLGMLLLVKKYVVFVIKTVRGSIS